MSVVETSTILEAHYERLRRFVRSRISDREEADDVVQEVCLRAVARIESLRESERAESWLFQIARNAIIDHYRRNRPALPLPDTLIDGEGLDEPGGLDLTGCMSRLLDGMDEADQVALRLTAYDGLKQRELAERLGLSLSGAKSRVQRARQRLHDLVVACCRPELDRLGGVININPPRTCSDDGECVCVDGCGAC